MRGRAPTLEPAAGMTVAQYRGSFSEDGSKHRFRASLFVAEPDRFHLEISGPVGGPQWIVDAGGGRLSLTWVPEGVAFVGKGGADPMARIVAIPAGSEDLVLAVLRGHPLEGVDSMDRRPASGEGYPESLEVRRGSRVLRLERVSVSAVPESSRRALGTGEPPPGIPRRPLEDLPGSVVPLAPSGGAP